MHSSLKNMLNPEISFSKSDAAKQDLEKKIVALKDMAWLKVSFSYLSTKKNSKSGF